MFEPEQICPYTGLRSFTEEESLYFKGREEDIEQATVQLQRNKFLMLTGASGDGKSSLIYAGIIPNARAGFLKSKYTQWCVADFRPERTPFHNLCRSIARQLDIDSPDTVQAELNHGFSAIIDLYKNSKRFIDTHSVAWQSADEAGKAAQKREAANLIILVDQFEEFFTNPENYRKGVPSGDANLVINLLLETARIALEEDLPVYVVFTMRSDYIGQCASFRGLPEFIGFSQFFVPRLNRTQLQQVIEEPATLSANRISRRLTERLIHDLTEGVDQLPILQHALNQVWHAADNGQEEMDLIHYAMVGGMPVNELPDEQTDRFKKWFEDLPPHIKNCYHKPDLQNVLDTHTNKLYEQAAGYYVQKTGKNISGEEAKAIIKSAFICLTKIDQSRAVRNRMTLKEITSILGRPGITTEDVGAVLNIFREPGNTFIRPFILDDPESHILKENDVLDITHESLIRNWEYLEQWAKEEYDNYAISLDFEQQLNRWVESGKSKSFLLSIGPLTYFENWFNTAKPNAHWIARYLPDDADQNIKLSNAKEVLSDAKEFLKRSAEKHVVTRAVMRYGAKRIAAVLGLVAVILLSSFAVRDYFRKQNDYVLRSVKSKSLDLVNDSKLNLEFSIPVITEQLILGNVTIPEVVSSVKDDNQKIRIATGIATQLISQGRIEPREEILLSLKIADSLLEQQTAAGISGGLTERLTQVHNYSATAGMAYFLNQNDSLKDIVESNAKRSAGLTMKILKDQPQGFSDIQHLSLALENGINNKIFSADEINQLLQILSPLENENRTSWIEKNYNRDIVLVRGGNNYGSKFNGLYQDLAYLYAASGKLEKVMQCIDTLLRYQESFHQNDYATHIENAANIAAVFYTYGTTDLFDDFVQGYCKRKNISSLEFYNRLVSRVLPETFAISYLDFYSGYGQQIFCNLNLQFSSDKMVSYFFTKLKEEIMKVKDADEQNFNLAVVFKNEGALYATRSQMRGISVAEQYFDEAVTYFQLTQEEYLNQNISAVRSAASDIVTIPRKFLFLFPDYRVPFHPFEPRSAMNFYYSPAFIKYVLDHNLFDTLYKNAGDFKYFETWLLDYHFTMIFKNFCLQEPMAGSIMDQLAAKLEERKANQSADLNILYLHLSEFAFEQKQIEKGISYLRQIQLDKLLNAFQEINFTPMNDYSLELVGEAIANLTANDQFDLAYKFINVFKKQINRSSLYAHASQMVSLGHQYPEITQRLLDSAVIEMKRLDNPAVFQPNRHNVAIAFMYKDPDENSGQAYRTIKNSFNKFDAINRFSEAYAIHGNLYQAQQQMPLLISTGDKAGFLYFIMKGFNVTKPQKEEWKKFHDYTPFFFRRFLVYVNENE